jgi:cytoskeletal protein RodZ
MSRKRSRARVGAKLRKARERCGLSLRQIADSTKISVPVLEGLERDEITYLPGGVLGRGYVRSFASTVKLDPEAIVAEFVAQFPGSSVTDGYPPAAQADGETPERSGPANPVKIRLNESSKLVRVASFGVVAVLLAGVVVFAAPKGWPPWASLQGWATRTPAVASSDSARLTPLNARAIQLVRPQVAPVLPSARVLAVKVTAKPEPTAVATSSVNAAVTTAAPSAPAPLTERNSTPVPSSEATPAVNEPIRIAVSVTSPSWVIAWIDGKKVVSRLFEAGEQETFEASRDVVVTGGDGGAVRITFDGAVTRSLGRTGKTASVRINHANLSKYLESSR